MVRMRLLCTVLLGILGAWVAIFPIITESRRVTVFTVSLFLMVVLLVADWKIERRNELERSHHESENERLRAGLLRLNRLVGSVVHDAARRSADRKNRARELTTEMRNFLAQRDATKPPDRWPYAGLSREERSRLADEDDNASSIYEEATSTEFLLRYRDRALSLVTEFVNAGVLSESDRWVTLVRNSPRILLHRGHVEKFGELAERDDSIVGNISTTPEGTA
jgi:hypothetical protein